MEKEQEKNTEEELVKEFDSSSPKSNKLNLLKISAFILLIGVFGAFSGVLIAKGTGSNSSAVNSTEIESAAEIKKGMKLGAGDPDIFKDTAEGVLVEGGVDGEGQYHLKREGGEDQYVYLTSSLVDLSLLEKRKIKVWGETFASEKAGWLMDVGIVEVLN